MIRNGGYIDDDNFNDLANLYKKYNIIFKYNVDNFKKNKAIVINSYFYPNLFLNIFEYFRTLDNYIIKLYNIHNPKNLYRLKKQMLYL